MPTPEELLAARYGAPVSWTPPQWNHTLDIIHQHRSVRRWLDKPVADDTIRTIISAAQSGSTSSNKQVISVIVVKDPEARKALSEISQQMFPHLEQVPVVLIWLIDFSRIRYAATREQLPTGAHDYLDEAALGFLDAGVAAQNAAIAAESLGLGTLYLGSVRNDVEAVQKLLGIPPEIVPVLGLEIGHPDPTEPAGIKPRLPQEAIVHWDTYSTPDPTHIDAYDQALDTYFSRYGQHQLWSTQMAHRAASTSTTKTNRKFLRRVLERAGFGLK
ncbi:NADPH-dependent oxidoreductase [Corynebacterium crudilactis]|uniref:NADPH-dependent oxidoreductase n=1 Tax=Corynebacterium crudilactis TaxID=1652495 RepID=A0A172QW94_9CORY|nr:NADPH-dependent oxidoreductase [Corynebacterium crudilactis]ANE04983.1 NADPH-dependent oxidoreductase [Corynebacterium crudilactis]